MSTLALGGVARFMASGKGGQGWPDIAIGVGAALGLVLTYPAVKRRRRSAAAPLGTTFSEYATLETPEDGVTEPDEVQKLRGRWSGLGRSGVLYVTHEGLRWSTPIRRRQASRTVDIPFGHMRAVYLTVLRTYPKGVGVDVVL